VSAPAAEAAATVVARAATEEPDRLHRSRPADAAGVIAAARARQRLNTRAKRCRVNRSRDPEIDHPYLSPVAR